MSEAILNTTAPAAADTSVPLAAPKPRLVPLPPRPKLQTPVTAGFTLIHWFYMYQLADGTKHIMRLTGVENYELVLAHAEQMHPGQTVELHQLKSDTEITDAWAKLAEDPAWYPVNEEALKAIKNAAVLGEAHPSNEPAGIVIAQS